MLNTVLCPLVQSTKLVPSILFEGSIYSHHLVTAPRPATTSTAFGMMATLPTFLRSLGWELSTAVGVPRPYPSTLGLSIAIGELPLLFGTHPNFRGNSTPFEYAVSETMQDLWVEFARDPSGFTEHWPVWNPDTQSMLVFGQGEIPSQVVNLTIATASTQAQMIGMCAA